jgi:hypothetical protein
MPIVFDKKRNTWVDQDLTEDEKQSLILIAIEVIRDQAGALVAETILEGHLRQKKEDAASLFMSGKFVV